MQDLALFWQLTLKTIEDLKIVSNENIAIEMFLMQLMHIKGMEDYSQEKVFGQENLTSSPSVKIKIEEDNKNSKPVSFATEQMKSTQQLKSITGDDQKTETKIETMKLLYLLIFKMAFSKSFKNFQF